MTPAAIVLQARMGSRRLPGKVLAPIGARSILAHCIQRLRASGLPVIVATTFEPEDDAVVREARRCGAEVFRGSDVDVLDRFIGAGRRFGLTGLLRATADNPFVDSVAPGRALALACALGADYVVERDLPVGAAVEAVTLDALERAAASPIEDADREHVTAYIRRAPEFAAHHVPAPVALRRRDMRLTVDTPEDLEFARALFDALGRPDEPVPLARVIAAAESLGREALEEMVAVGGAL